MATGLTVAFLGMDGIGKSTLCRAFEERMRAAGQEVVTIAWRSVLPQADAPWPAVALQQLWLETFRCLYGGGLRGGERIDLPRDYPSWEAGGHEKELAAEPVHENSAAGALAAAFVEIAGNVILASEVAGPALRRGAVVVQESYPLKHVLKELMVARRLADAQDGDRTAELTEFLYDALTSVFGSALLQPDVGILIDGRAADAYRWRTAQKGAIGALEDYGPAGERSEDSFLTMQEETAGVFRAVTEKWGWIRHEVDDSGVEANTARALGALLAHPRIAERLAEGR
ncbi:hypothetical protein ACQKM2_37105 [Streptomyces sp. NPDC004126]|uniref:hypothetical protein n=1 Tax=Streptomyces sp. NPDC004126 TaxID=3390695 RepID=UPI003D0528B7